MSLRALKVALPLIVAAAALALWEGAVRHYHVPIYVLPPPSAIAATLIADHSSLLASAWVTLRVTLAAFGLALASGFVLAILFAHSRVIEFSLAPYAVALQATPVVAIAPLISIWVGSERPELALLILAWIVAFFPILTGATVGLRSADPNLVDLFRLNGATPWQRLLRLELPSALPHLLNGMKVSGALALIGAVVAEFAAGSGASTGLAWRIMEASYRLQIPRMFAALTLLVGMGIAIYFSLSLLEHRLLRHWHASAKKNER